MQRENYELSLMPISVPIRISFYTYACMGLVGFLGNNLLSRENYVVFKSRIITSQKRRAAVSPFLKINESLANEPVFFIGAWMIVCPYPVGLKKQ